MPPLAKVQCHESGLDLKRTQRAPVKDCDGAAGTIEVRTRKEVISWLEMIMHESRIQASGGLQEEVEHLGEQTPSNPDGLYYVRHECVAVLHIRTQPLLFATTESPCFGCILDPPPSSQRS